MSEPSKWPSPDDVHQLIAQSSVLRSLLIDLRLLPEHPARSKANRSKILLIALHFKKGIDDACAERGKRIAELESALLEAGNTVRELQDWKQQAIKRDSLESLQKENAWLRQRLGEMEAL